MYLVDEIDSFQYRINIVIYYMLDDITFSIILFLF